MKKLLLFSGLATLSLVVMTGCSGNAAPTTTTTVEPTTTLTPSTTTTMPTVVDNYTQKAIKVYYKDSNENHNIRLYQKTGNVPYLGMKDFYKLLLKKTASSGISDLTVTKSGDKYKISSPRGYDAYVDVNENTLYSDNLTNFVNTSSFLKNYPVTTYDGMPFVRLKSHESLTKARGVLIDFDDYHMDVFGDDNDVYLPIQTLSDLFNGMNLLYAAYNTKDLYIVNGENEEDLFDLYPNYNEDLFSSSATKEYYEYAYNELCLFYDFFLERTGRTGLEKTYDLSKGLAKALESDDFGREMKTLITAGNIPDYLTGITILGQTMYDGGHTVYDARYAFILGNGGDVSWITNDIIGQINTKYTEVVSKGYKAWVNRDNTSHSIRGIREKRNTALGKEGTGLHGTSTYTEHNSLAMIHIDDYMAECTNRAEWNKYYSGKRATIPYSATEGGAVAALYKGFEQARANSNIKTVILDLGANSGGSSDELMYLVNFLTGNDKFYMRDLLTNELITETFEVDKNLDGKFDENDKTYNPIGDLDVIVLTSEASFSCGGISPIYLHDLGLTVIGENCGGGSCAIVRRSDGLGVYNVAGTYFNFLSPKRKASIDYERFYVCDCFIDKEDAQDYSKFYDLDYLETLVENL